MSSTPRRIAIIGPGAIGGTIAAHLSRSSHDLTLCVRSRFDRLVVHGVSAGAEPVDIKPRVLSFDPSEASSLVVDWIIAVTKTYDTEGATHWIERLRGPSGSSPPVAIVQNGVEHMERFALVCAKEQMLPVIINVPAERSAPGQIRHRGPGTIVVPSGELGASFVALFPSESSLEASTTDDFTSVAWRKLVVNSAGVVSALTLKPAGIAQNEKAAALIRGIAAETVAVGRAAAGADLADTLPDEVVLRLLASPPDSINSMLADRLAHRPTEIDARNGVVVRLGAKHGIPTPLNAMAVALIEAME